jgi:hypothetical protein
MEGYLFIQKRYVNRVNIMELSEHTKAMRSALNHCMSFFHSRDTDPDPLIANQLAKDALQASECISNYRLEALQAFVETNRKSCSSSIPTVHIDDMSPEEFRQEFLRCNRPCLIRGIQDKPYFAQVHQDWTTMGTGTGTPASINVQWFQENVGNDTLVPVRKETSGAIDDDGRAEECQVIAIPLREWIQNDRSDKTMYLKDWHLVQFLGQQIYFVPPLFQKDLLNAFGTTFLNGDYKFVYWGPAGSKTPLHSDVLHSFSWSYNVVGEKKWTFHVNNHMDSALEEMGVVVVHQHAGEAMFVPATWKHEVENVVETLSINHNWVTTDNIDLTWACVETEMVAVRFEMKKWGLDGHEAMEKMLRGCIGIDVTMFFLLCWTSLLEPWGQKEKSRDDYFDIFRLGSMMEKLFSMEDLDLQARLAIVLVSETKADDAVRVARRILRQIKILQESLL